MDLQSKLNILGEAAKYDVSCSSSGSKRVNKGGIGNAAPPGICHSWAADGRCISLLKILLTNKCIYNCAYCNNRCTSDTPRGEFTPEEVANLTIEFYKRNYIEGLFLSSGVIKNPDYTMELLIRTLSLLREQYRFFGYIHVKVIPGADPLLINKIGVLADRVSVNIELPSQESLKLFAPQKDKDAIIKPMSYISRLKTANAEEKKSLKLAGSFVPAGQTTQLIVGASSESDMHIMRLTQGLYDKYSLKRVYYSAYVPVGNHPALPAAITSPPLLREHRLYQADWLLRFYGFRAEELLDNSSPNFLTDVDPKCGWALRNLQLFPVDVNKADYAMLLRVPGIGVVSAQRIVKARRVQGLSLDALKKLGVVMKRARYFITANGQHSGANYLGSGYLKSFITDSLPAPIIEQRFEQLTFFIPPQAVLAGDSIRGLITGQL